MLIQTSAAALLSGLALAAGDAPPAAAPADEKLVCRSERITGSRISHNRICLLKNEWDHQAREAEELTKRMSNASKSGIPPRSPPTRGGN